MQSAGSVVMHSLPGTGDTIVAIATATGRGAVSIIRLSGPRAREIATRHITPFFDKPKETHLSEIRDGERTVLDRALVSVFHAPNSFTGEDVVEVSSHGGRVVPQSIVSAFIGAGARPAEPGEFTRRAVFNGKIDVMQAEAIADLVDARSSAMQKTALSQLDGALSRRIHELRNSLLELEAFLAYDIDFPEEDDGPVSREKIERAASEALAAIRALISTGRVGELQREGAVVVIAGPPNVGKSSLFNALLGHSRAIVTDLPGTTRDALEGIIDAGRFPVRLVDTAGLREPSDYVEQLGIEVSRKYLHAADVVLACSDNTEDLETTTSSLRATTPAHVIPVLTKSDLVTKRFELPPDAMAISAISGTGLGELVLKVQGVLEKKHPVPADVPVLTRARHLAAVAAAGAELEGFIKSWTAENIPATVAAIHVRSAAAALEELIGVVDVEHVLDKVFSSFCVGK